MWFGGYGYDDGGLPGRGERDGWAEKSSAATAREDCAKKMLDSWIELCSKFDVAKFPVEEASLIPAKVHLTDACWKSFRKYAINEKGVKVGRREATPQERKESGDKRRGKLYVISVKLLVHPSNAVEASKTKKEKAKVALEKRKEREAQREEERKLAELVKRQKVITVYQRILQEKEPNEQEETTIAPVVTGSSSASSDIPEILTNDGNASNSKNKDDSNNNDDAGVDVDVDVDPEEILKYADEAYAMKRKEIRLSIQKKKTAYLAELEKSQESLEREALKVCTDIKASIVADLTPSTKVCSKGSK